MNPRRILVLGGTGMLGSMIVRLLSATAGIELTATVRDEKLAASAQATHREVHWTVFDASRDEPAEVVRGADWIVNCIGLIKPLIVEQEPASIQQAIMLNALFPHALRPAAAAVGARVIQIATDCVYAGSIGGYVESSPHDPLDVYGKTKSLGEVRALTWHNIRCSIVGPESGRSRSLLEWFLAQPHGGQVKGYVDQRWNGVTTLHFAKLVREIIRNDAELPEVQHLVPGDQVTKAELLHLFARSFGRGDLVIVDAPSGAPLDRTLDSERPDILARLWRLAGYEIAPTVGRMVEELAALRGGCRSS